MQSKSVEDYLKRIYVVQEESGIRRVPTGRIAADLGLTPGSVTAMLKSLAAAGLVDHAPYGGVRLTPTGSRQARQVLRRHRLIELFLVEMLGMPWTDVHAEAEQLEHALSDRVLERIDAKLGYPQRDPHGHWIPRSGGGVRGESGRPLDGAPPGRALRVLSVSDESPQFLRGLEGHGLRPAARVRVLARSEAMGIIELRVGRGEPFALSLAAAAKVAVAAD